MPAIERVVTLECAGSGRSRCGPCRQASPGATRPSRRFRKGALLHDVLERAKPLDTGVDVLFAGADHGSYILNPALQDVEASDFSLNGR